MQVSPLRFSAIGKTTVFSKMKNRTAAEEKAAIFMNVLDTASNLVTKEEKDVLAAIARHNALVRPTELVFADQVKNYLQGLLGIKAPNKPDEMLIIPNDDLEIIVGDDRDKHFFQSMSMAYRLFAQLGYISNGSLTVKEVRGALNELLQTSGGFTGALFGNSVSEDEPFQEHLNAYEEPEEASDTEDDKLDIEELLRIADEMEKNNKKK